MKKMLALLLGMLLLLSLCACGNAAPATSGAGAAAGSGSSDDAQASESTEAPIALPEPEPIPDQYDTITLEHLFDLPADLDGCAFLGMLGNNIVYKQNSADAVSIPSTVGYKTGAPFEAESYLFNGDPELVPLGLLRLDGSIQTTGYAAFRLVSEQYGLIGFREIKDDINRWGLMDMDGNVVLDACAAFINPINERFCYVFTSAVEIDDANEAMFFFTETDGFSSIATSDDADMYTGDYLLYDCQSCDFVPGIALDNPTLLNISVAVSLQGVSDEYIAIYFKDSSTLTFYDGAGTAVYSMTGDGYKARFSDSYIVVSSSSTDAKDYGTLYIFDNDLKPLANYDLDSLSWNYSKPVCDRYLCLMDSDNGGLFSVLDLQTMQRYDSTIQLTSLYYVNSVEGMDAVALKARDDTCGLYSLPDFTKLMDLVSISRQDECAFVNGFLYSSSSVYDRNGGLLSNTFFASPFLIPYADRSDAFTALLTGETVSDENLSVFYSVPLAPFIFGDSVLSEMLFETLQGTILLPFGVYSAVTANDSFAAAYSELTGMLEVYRIVRS